MQGLNFRHKSEGKGSRGGKKEGTVILLINKYKAKSEGITNINTSLMTLLLSDEKKTRLKSDGGKVEEKPCQCFLVVEMPALH